MITRSEEETLDLAGRFSAYLGSGDVVALFGELGAGKTLFVRGVCRGLGVKEAVTSPTFTLVQEYRGKLPVYHVDFYRLEAAAIYELDLDWYFRSEGITLIEWAERGLGVLPEHRYEVRLSYTNTSGENARKVIIVSPDEKAFEDGLA
jgi:tRNA threonylcarbamoyladenosine biosynthesis protein TsaE